jgi:hypothetical protein
MDVPMLDAPKERGGGGGDGDEKKDIDPKTASIDELKKRVRVCTTPFENDVRYNSDIHPHNLGPHIDIFQGNQLLQNSIENTQRLIARLAMLERAADNQFFNYMDFNMTRRIADYFETEPKSEARTKYLALAQDLLDVGGVIAARRQALWGHWGFVKWGVFVRWQRSIHSSSDQEKRWNRFVTRSSSRDERLLVVNDLILLHHRTEQMIQMVLSVQRGTAIYPELQQRPFQFPIDLVKARQARYGIDLVTAQAIRLNRHLVEAWMGVGPRYLRTNDITRGSGRTLFAKAERKMRKYVKKTKAWRELWERVQTWYWLHFTRLRRRPREQAPQKPRPGEFTLVRPYEKKPPKTESKAFWLDLPNP